MTALGPEITRPIATLTPTRGENLMPAVAAPVLDGIDLSIVNHIAACVSARGYPPTVREIGEEIGMASTSSVHHRLRKLERAGVLRRAEGHSRAITLTDDGAAA